MIDCSNGNFIGKNPEKVIRQSDKEQRRLDKLKHMRELKEYEIQNSVPPTEEMFKEWEKVRKDINKKLQERKNRETREQREE